MALIIFRLQDAAGHRLGGVVAQSVGGPGPWAATSNACGDMITNLQPAHYDITFSKPGYVTRVLPADLGDCGIVTVGLESAAPIWPSGLHNWSGAFCIPDAMPDAPYGDGRRIWTPAYGVYSDAWRAEMLARYKRRPYTHFVYNIASPDGVYHNDYPALADDPTRARRDLTEILSAGLIPVVACCNDANGGSVTPYVSVAACADLIPIAFPMWEMNGPLGVDTMVNGISVGRVGDCIRATRAALLPQTLLYVHFTAGHGAGAEPEGAWWQWFAAADNGQGLLSQDDHWDDPTVTASGLTDTARHLHGHVAGWEGLDLDNVAFELQTTVLYHNASETPSGGRTEAQGLAFMAQVLGQAQGIAGFCDSGPR